MFEYAISCGEGTLLEYGVASGPALNTRLKVEEESPNVFFSIHGYTCYEIGIGEYVVVRPASPDCQTGQ